MDKYLLPLLKECQSLPFLFIGSGLTRRYYGLPDWLGLLKNLANKIYDNEFQFAKITQEASERYNRETEYNRFMTYISDYLARDLNEVWYNRADFHSSREKHKELALEKMVSPFKIEISEYIKEKSEILFQYNNEIEALKKLSNKSIAGIITTNYDTFLESIFSYEVYSSQDSLLFKNNYEVGEIYKIHGCVNEPETIMITSKDYAVIEDKNKYIAAKLLTIFIEHPVFFIGYSLGDEDIKKILFDIVKCLNTEQLKFIEKRLFFVTWDSTEKDYRSESYTLEFDNKQVISMTRIFVNDFSKIYDVMAKNQSKYPVKILRTMKKDMYNMVLTNDPKNRMMITMAGDQIDEEKLDKIQFLYGFGVVELAKKGYGQPEASEIFYDIVLNNMLYDPDALLTMTIPQKEKFYGELPVYKYLCSASPEVIQGLDLESKMNKTYDDFLNTNIISAKKKYKSIQEIRKLQFSIKKEMVEIEKLREHDMDLEQLGEYLKAILMEYPTALDATAGIFKVAGMKTRLRRLIKIYDWLKYSKSKGTL